jgi:hypothetical protein
MTSILHFLIYACILSEALTSALAPLLSRLHHGCNLKSSVLSAAHPASSGGPSWGSRGFPSKTARESAFNVEWEPMTELDRRIEDGVNYEHMPNQAHRRQSGNKGNQDSSVDDETPSARGVFCGYRSTSEDYDRLKSANLGL